VTSADLGVAALGVGNGGQLAAGVKLSFLPVAACSSSQSCLVHVRRVRARPMPRRQSRYVIRLPAILAGLCRIVHR
jgi:hypothetical protein